MSMQAIERIKLPKPDTHCFDTDTDSDVWSYSPELVRETVLTHIDKLEKLAEERLQNCAALVAEVERLRKDAGRYQWLRSQHWSDGQLAVVVNAKVNVRLGANCPSHELLDEAIDAAMKGTP